MIKVFYSYSNHNSETCDTYQKVCSYFENNDDNIDIIDVDKTDDNNNILLLNKIQYHIDSSTIFICDITPDYVINKIYNQISKNYYFLFLLLFFGSISFSFSSSDIIIFSTSWIFFGFILQFLMCAPKLALFFPE